MTFSAARARRFNALYKPFAALILTLVLIAQGMASPGRLVQAADIPENPAPFSLVADVASGTDSSLPENLFAIGDTLFFSAYNAQTGTELWKSIPPYTSATLVADINPGGSASKPNHLSANKDVLLFQADDGQHGRELWKSLPPYTSASLVTDLNPDGNANPAGMTSIGTATFFSADNGRDGTELWMTQSPFNSARQVTDLFPGSGSSDPDHLTTMGWMLFFTANDSQGREVWMTQPQYDAGSTRRVENIFPGDYTSPEQLYALDTTLFFSAVDNTGAGMELWKSEPPFTPESTSKVAKYAYLFSSPDPHNLVSIGNTLFYSAEINTIGMELWKSVPPYALTSTTRVDDINEGFFSSEPDQKTPIGSTLLFTASDGKTGYELWRTVPPYQKAEQVIDFYEGSTHAWPRDLVRMGSTLFLTAQDTGGRQIWQVDAPYTTATKITNVRWPYADAEPAQLLVVGNTLFFVAWDAEHGIEVRKLDMSALLPMTGFEPGVVTRVNSLAPDLAYAPQGVRLVIPKLSLDRAVVSVPQAAGGWNLDWLDADVGHLQGSAFPTRVGDSWLTAHVVGRDGLAGPFGNLKQLGWGDQVEVLAWGDRYIYEVRSVETVAADGQIDAIEDGHTWLTLITCADYDKASRSYLNRLLVRAVLVTVETIP